MQKKWKRLHRTLKLKSSWVTVYSDVLRDNNGKELEYWHYERPDSVVVIVIRDGKFLLPEPQYRVGIDEFMLDFAGSRIAKGQSPKAAGLNVIKKELGIDKSAVESIEPITKTPMAVDSSFSTQRLHGYAVRVKKDMVPGEQIQSFKSSEDLRAKLECVQCKFLLDEFLLQKP